VPVIVAALCEALDTKDDGMYPKKRRGGRTSVDSLQLYWVTVGIVYCSNVAMYVI
jgi:hypothetical protein